MARRHQWGSHAVRRISRRKWAAYHLVASQRRLRTGESVLILQVPRPIVFAVDNSYLTPLRTAIDSIERACEPEIGKLRIIVLHEGVDELSRRLLRLGRYVEWREVRLPVEVQLPIADWISRAAYYRLAIGKALPDYDSCLYLDVDILVLESVVELLTKPMSCSPVAAVRDPQTPILRDGTALPCWRELGLPETREYFNSGVMLLNLPACREQCLFERAWDFVVRRPECVRYWDQDALNWAVNDDWERLDRCWNTFPMSAILRTPGEHEYVEDVLPLDMLLADESRARILHYAGPVKPWHPDFPDGFARDAYTEVHRRLYSP